jgi:hypothetical protein
VDRFNELAPLLPGAQGIVYDTALRGTHHQRLMRELGWLSVNRVTAASGSRKQGGGKKRKRIEKVTWVETKTITTPTGEQEVRLIADGGRIGLGETTETGEPVFVPLERVRTHRNADKGGTYRWYNDYRLPERLGGGTVTVRLHTNDEDRQRRFNRDETSARSRLVIRTSSRSTSGVTMPRASTDISTTRSGCDERTASVGDGSC